MSPAIDASKNLAHGDFSTAVCLTLAKPLRSSPQEIAAKVLIQLTGQDSKNRFEKIDNQRGYLNFYLTNSALLDALKEVLNKKEQYLRLENRKKEKVLLEYVSANPTGPLHIGHGRWAILGDNLARIMDAAGYQVKREFYINDVGRQIDLLVESVRAAAKGEAAPEGGYGGFYVKDLAETFKKDLNKGNFKDKLLSYILNHQKKVLEKLQVRFDSWFPENQLHRKGKVKEIIQKLKAANHTFELDGAVWFRSTAFGDDKDRVLVRDQGATTYFAADVAYHADKYRRGFDRLIDIWGTDHHGYVKRIFSALEALGLDEKRLEIIIGQLVTLFRGKEVIRMSKRTGEMVTLEEVTDEIGADATRFFLASSDENTHLDFDLQLAKEKSQDNPVYYVQYAHARICSILREAESRKMGAKGNILHVDLPLNETERKLVGKLISLPEEIEIAAEKRSPHRLIQYLRDLAVNFHHFYQFNRVLIEDEKLRQNRLALVTATRIVLSNVLKLLGVSAPERM